MFKAGKFYLCIKKKDISSESINSFISTVFGNSYGREYRLNRGSGKFARYYNSDEYADSCIGLFYEGHIYRCPTDGALIDSKGSLVFINDASGYGFEEVPFDNSDIEPIATKLREECRCSVSVFPSVKIGDMILYSCKVTVVGFKNIGVGEAMTENKMNGLRLAYREARKNLLTKTKLFKSLYSYEI
jgi:hypothetical protein